MRRTAIVLKVAMLLLALSTAAFAQLSGTYYIGASGTRPGGGDPEYATLKAACDDANTNGISGDVTFYITSNLTEPANVALAVNSGGNLVTFKPYTGTTDTVTYTQTADNGGTSGAWVIGQLTSSGAPLVSTSNIVIDGSNIGGGTTRNLTFVSDSGTNAYPFRIRGDCNDITIKNCVLRAGRSTIAYGIWINAVNSASVDSVPNNITVLNCQITATAGTSGTPIHIAQSGTIDTLPTGIAIRGNTLIARHRGVFYQYLSGLEVSGNVIQVNQTTTGYLSVAVQGNLGNTGSINVFNNQFTQLQTANTAAGAYGIRAIAASGGGTYYIYNNFITGFATPATGTAEAVGIRVGVASNIYHNTIVMNDVSTTGPGTTPTAGVVTYTTSCDVRDNIIITNEDNFASYCIYASSLPATCDFNDLYRSGTTNAKIGYYGGALADLSAWQDSSHKDYGSHSVAVNFTSATDLHLSGVYPAGSIGDVNLTGTPIGSVTTDIDGQTRDASFPYVGADEHPESPLPVEIVSFSAAASTRGVDLCWSTSTETNNYGFEIERRAVGSDSWQKIGFVPGAGTTTSKREYSYTDAGLAPGHYAYRIKQIDNDGASKYIGAAEIEVGSVPKQLSLAQNYPNPFNPTTTINFTLSESGKATLKIYNLLGQEVGILFDGDAEAGQLYTATFDGSRFASGVYIYVLESNGQRMIKKMNFVK